MNIQKIKRAMKVGLIAIGIGFGINLLVTYAAVPTVKTYYYNGTQTYQFKNKPPAYTWISWNQYITPSNDHYNFFSYWGRPSNFKWRDRYTGDNGTTWTGWSAWMTGSQTPTKTHHEGENNRYYRQIQVYHGTTHKVTLSSWRALIDDKYADVSYSPNTSDYKSANFTVRVTGSDDASGFKQMRTQLVVNGTAKGWSGWTTSSAKDVTISTTGNTYIQTDIIDKVNNRRTVNSKTFRIERTAPIHKPTTLYDARHVSGNDYWYRPGDSFRARVVGYDNQSKMKYNYLRLLGDGNDNRASHQWGVHSDGQVNEFNSGEYTDITGGTSPYYGYTAEYIFNGRIHTTAAGKTFVVQDYFTDHAGNTFGYNDTSKRMKVDGSAPYANRVWIDHVTMDSFYVYIDGVGDSHSGVKEVRFPTWTYANGQDDIASSWTSNSSVVGENRGGGVWRYKVNRSTHNYEFGRYDIHPYVYDNMGYAKGYSIVYTLRDTVKPDLSVSASTTAWTRGNVTATVTGRDVHTGLRSFTLPNGTVATKNAGKGVTTSHTYTITSNGTYSFKGTDNYGNVTTQTLTVSNIDKTAPTSSVYGNPSSWTKNNVTLSVNPSDSQSGYYRTRLPNGTYSYSTAPTYTVSANGTYSFVMYDKVGNYRTVSTTVSKIDKTIPTGSITGNPTSWTKANATLKLTAADTGGSGYYRTRLPNGAYSYSTAPTYTATSNGTYTFVVYDHAGNYKYVSTAVSKIDKTIPTGSITGNPTSWTKANATLKLTAADTGGSGYYRTRLPNGTYSTSTAPTYTVSSNGTYSFVVYDHAGNYRTVSTTVSKIDKTVPTGTISGNPTSWTNGNATLKLTASDTGGSGYYRTRLPNGTYSTSTAPTYTATSNGTYTFTVYDHAGNYKYVSIAVNRIDKTAPTGTIGGNPSSWTKNNVTLTLSASDTGGSGYYRTRLPNGTFSTSTAPTYTVSANGTYSFIAYDHAGNSRTVSATVSKIDKTIPTPKDATVYDARYISGNDHWYRPGDPFRVKVVGYDANAQLRYSYVRLAGDGNDNRAQHDWNQATSHVYEFGTTGGYTRITSGTAGIIGTTKEYIFRGAVQSTAGNRTFAVQDYFTDHAGNIIGYRSTGKRIRTDATNPTVSASTTSRGWANSNVSVALTFADGQSGVQSKQYTWSTSMSTPSTWSNYSSTVTQSSNGTWYLHARAVDNVGRAITQRFGPYRIDKTLPAGSISGNPTSWINGNVTLKLSASDTGGSGYYRTKLPNGTYSTSTAPTYTVSSNGTYSFVVYDHAGNYRTVSTTVSKIDKTAPTGSISGNPTSWTKNNVTLTLSASDAGGSGYYRTKLPNGTYSTSTAPAYTVSVNGAYTFVVYDHAGNSTNVSATVSKIDKTAPGNTLTKTPTSWTNQPVTVLVRGDDSQSGVNTIEQINQSTLNGRNFVRNSQLDSKSYSAGWNTTLNGSLAPNGYWSSGYNGGVSSPTVGYHAHLNTSTFGYPVLRYVNKNSPYGQTNRWMGFAQGFGSTSDIGKALTVGQKITVSFDLRSDKVGGTIHGGFYRVRKSTGTHAFVKTDYLKATKANTWERVSYTQTVDSDWDLTKSFSLYMYGSSGDSEATKYVKDVKVELGDTNTPYTIAPEDAMTAGSENMLKATDTPTSYTPYNSAWTKKDDVTFETTVVRANSLTFRYNSLYSLLQGGGYVFSGYLYVDGQPIQPGSFKDFNTYYGSNLKIREDGYFVHEVPKNTTSWLFHATGQSSHLNVGSKVTLKYPKIEKGSNVDTATPFKASNSVNHIDMRTFTVAQNGTYTYRVTDNVGNVKDTNVTITNIDTTLPGGSISGNPTSWTNANATLTFTATDAGGSGVKRVRIAGGTWVTGTSVSRTVSSNGSYSFEVEDHAGNTKTISTTVSKIDKVLPSGSITGNPTSWTNQNVTLRLSTSDSGGSGYYRTKLPNGTFSTSTAPTYTATANGTYTFVVYDHAGNSKTVSATVTKIDKILPNGTITGNPTAWTNQNVTLTFKATDLGGSNVKRVKRPNGTWVNGSTTAYTVSANGTYTFSVEDYAGNLRNVSVTVTKIDKVIPALSITGNPSNWVGTDVVLTINATDSGGSGVKAIVLPNGNVLSGTSATYTVPLNATLTFKVIDHAGNSKTYTIYVTKIDKVKPTGTVVPSTTNWTNQNVTLTVSSSDSASGVKEIVRPDGTKVALSNTTFVVKHNGTYSFKIVDNVGNTTTKTITVANIDKEPPSETIIDIVK